jgi:O-succinylbenzoic acid--CoA ligase
LNSTSPYLHPAFKFNGLQYQIEDLMDFAKDLVKKGDKHEVKIGKFIQKWFDENEQIKVNTSGSTGDPKEIFLKKSHMLNSARETGVFFKLGENTSALLCLPSDFIAGKMMLVRAMTLGWDLHVVAPEKDALTQYDNDYDFVAMVPYQVNYSFGALGKVKKLIIGGGSISEELEEKLMEVDTEVFETYGMTETVTHIAVRRINGLARSEYFTALPNVRFSTDERNCLVIDAPSISDHQVITNDIVDLLTPTTFIWKGRYDHVINSGGVKLFPEAIEKKLAPYIKLPFIISSLKDQELGECVILIVKKPKEHELPDFSEAFSVLNKYERPRKVFSFSKFPYTSTGKIKRTRIIRLLEERLKN